VLQHGAKGPGGDSRDPPWRSRLRTLKLKRFVRCYASEGHAYYAFASPGHLSQVLHIPKCRPKVITNECVRLLATAQPIRRLSDKISELY
jgi:hypothetical protein